MDKIASGTLAFLRAAAYVALTVPLMPLQALFVALDWRQAASLPRWYHARCARLFGVDRAGIGLLARTEPDGPWREFRFAFSTEVRDTAALEAALRDMADEAQAALAEEEPKQ